MKFICTKDEFAKASHRCLKNREGIGCRDGCVLFEYCSECGTTFVDVADIQQVREHEGTV